MEPKSQERPTTIRAGKLVAIRSSRGCTAGNCEWSQSDERDRRIDSFGGEYRNVRRDGLVLGLGDDNNDFVVGVVGACDLAGRLPGVSGRPCLNSPVKKNCGD